MGSCICYKEFWAGLFLCFWILDFVLLYPALNFAFRIGIIYLRFAW